MYCGDGGFILVDHNARTAVFSGMLHLLLTPQIGKSTTNLGGLLSLNARPNFPMASLSPNSCCASSRVPLYLQIQPFSSSWKTRFRVVEKSDSVDCQLVEWTDSGAVSSLLSSVWGNNQKQEYCR